MFWVFILLLLVVFILIFTSRHSLIKDYKTISFFLIIVAISSIPIAYILLKTGRYLKIYNTELKIGTPDGWLGFIGSILGSIITLVALIISFDNENKNRREDKLAESIAFLSLEKIEESQETLGAGDGLIFNHLIELKNNSSVPALNFELNLEKSKLTYNTENTLVKKTIYLNEFETTHENKVYIPPGATYVHTLRLGTSKKMQDKLGLFQDNDVQLHNVTLNLVFNYNGLYSIHKKAKYMIEIHLGNTTLKDYGLIQYLTTIQTDENWTPIFQQGLIEKFEMPKF